jgi:hypothetical protein
MRYRISLESATNLAIIAAAIVFIATMGKVWVDHSRAPEREPTPRYVRGDIVSDLPGMTAGVFAEGNTALFVFVNSACAFCTTSMPFYARLLDLSRGGAVAPIVFASRESRSATRDYLEQNGISGVEIVELGHERAPKLRLTPTMLLISSTGLVLEQWTGQQSTDGEATVVRALTESQQAGLD